METPLASRLDRFWASLIDWWILVGPVMFIGDLHETAFIRALAAVVWVGALAYQLVLARRGQSVGKQLRGIQVVRLDGSAVTRWRIVFLRNALFFIAPIDAAFIFRKDRRCLHDLLADTKVLKVARSGT